MSQRSRISVRWCLPGLLAVIGQVIVLAGPAWSQEPAAQPAQPPAVTGRIIGRIWNTRTRFSDGFAWMQQLREELGLQQGPLLMMMPGRLTLGAGGFAFGRSGPGGSQPAAPAVELKGLLLFLQTQPEPSLNNPIAFELVGSEAEFEKRLRDQASALGPMAQLIGAGDRYELKLTPPGTGQVARVPADQPGAANAADGKARTVQTFSIAIKVDSSRGGAGAAGAGPAAGLPTSISTYYRCVDGIMFSSRSPAVHTLDLPTQESLRLDVAEAAHDLYADLDLREIPLELKRAFWATVESSAATLLQRFDHEALGDYSWRKSMGEGRLELLRAALFDVERARFSLSLSSDGVTPIHSRLQITAREASPLARALDGVSRQPSQLAALRDADSPLVVSSTLSLPEWTQPYAAGLAESLRLKLQQLVGPESGAAVLVDDLLQPVQASLVAGRLDGVVCLRGDRQQGLVLAAGLRLEDAERFLGNLESLLLLHGAERGLTVRRLPVGDHSVLSLRAEGVSVPGTAQQLPLQVHMAAVGSRLWLTLGGDREEGDASLAVLQDLLQPDEDQPRRAGQALPLLVRFRLDQWLGPDATGAGDQFSGLPRVLMTELERWLNQATTPRLSVSVNGQAVQQPATSPQFTSYAERVLKPETSQLEVQVQAAAQELVVDATVGTSVVKFLAAQYLDAQSRLFSSLPLQLSVPAGGGTRVQSIRIGR